MFLFSTSHIFFSLSLFSFIISFPSQFSVSLSHFHTSSLLSPFSHIFIFFSFTILSDSLTFLLSSLSQILIKITHIPPINFRENSQSNQKISRKINYNSQSMNHKAAHSKKKFNCKSCLLCKREK